MINESVFQRYLPEFEGRGKTISQYMVPSYYWLGWGIKGNREIYAHDYHAKLVWGFMNGLSVVLTKIQLTC